MTGKTDERDLRDGSQPVSHRRDCGRGCRPWKVRDQLDWTRREKQPE